MKQNLAFPTHIVSISEMSTLPCLSNQWTCGSGTSSKSQKMEFVARHLNAVIWKMVGTEAVGYDRC